MTEDLSPCLSDEITANKLPLLNAMLGANSQLLGIQLLRSKDIHFNIVNHGGHVIIEAITNDEKVIGSMTSGKTQIWEQFEVFRVGLQTASVYIDRYNDEELEIIFEDADSSLRIFTVTP